MKYLRAWRYQQTVKEIERLTALAAQIKAELVENKQDPEQALAFDFINGPFITKSKDDEDIR